MDDYIPYSRQDIDEDDIQAVVNVLRSDFLTTGPVVAEFERAFSDYLGVKHSVAVSNGTAALHCALSALGIGPDDEVIVPPITFIATANAVVFQGATPVFADVDADTLLIDPAAVEACITPRTRAVIAVDFAGQPCDYAALRDITLRNGLALISDACHALGAMCGAEQVGTLADITVFSFHPVKHITTGEGGMAVTKDAELAAKMRTFRNHGIDRDSNRRNQQCDWRYEMNSLGYNYRINDFQCALGISQLKKMPGWLARRQQIADLYAEKLTGVAVSLGVRAGITHAWHLYVVCLPASERERVFREMREQGVGVNVHYIPVHLQPFYQENFSSRVGQCPVAEAAYEGLLSLPMYPALTDDEVVRVCRTLAQLISKRPSA